MRERKVNALFLTLLIFTPLLLAPQSVLASVSSSLQNENYLNTTEESMQTSSSATLLLWTDKDTYHRQESVLATTRFLYQEMPVSEASVTLETTFPNNTSWFIWTNITDDNGYTTFQFLLPAWAPAGEYEIYATGYKTGLENASATTRFTVPQAGAIDGTVADASTGLPVVGATVTANGYSATTDSTGYYILTDVPAGTYTVTAEASGYYSDTKTGIVVESGVNTTVNFTLSLIVGWIDGYVTDASVGAALVGATVAADGVYTTTDATGYYNIETVPATYTVTASMTGYLDGAATGVIVTAGETTSVHFSLTRIPETGTISGTITDVSTGDPIAGATVSIDTAYSASTDSFGVYTIDNVSPGDYTVAVSASGYTDKSQTATVTAGETTIVNFVLTSIPPNGTLSVTTTPVAGEVFVNGSSWGVAPISKTVAVGTYNVSFGDVEGYYTPPDQITSVYENVETTVEGIYESIPGIVVTEITNPELVNATNPFVVNATEEAATSLFISEISDPVTIVVKNVTDPIGVDPPPGTWKVLGNYVQISVNDTDITVNATIRIYYTLEQLEAYGLDESTLEIRFWNTTSGEWEPVESHVNTEEHFVWANIDHFSLWALMGQPPTSVWTPQLLAIVGIAVAVIAIFTIFLVIRKRKPLQPSRSQPKTR